MESFLRLLGLFFGRVPGDLDTGSEVRGKEFPFLLFTSSSQFLFMFAILSRILVGATEPLVPGLSGLLRLAIRSRTLPMGPGPAEAFSSVSAKTDPSVEAEDSSWVYSPDFLSTPTILQGRGLGGGRGLFSSSVSSLLLLPTSNAAARSPIMEEEECLIVSVSEGLGSSRKGFWESGLGWDGLEGLEILVDKPVLLKDTGKMS